MDPESKLVNRTQRGCWRWRAGAVLHEAQQRLAAASETRVCPKTRARSASPCQPCSAVGLGLQEHTSRRQACG
jgi:hypothetical protein